MTLAEGKKAPAFTLPDSNGNTVSLKDFKGKHWKKVAKAADHPARVLEAIKNLV